MWLNLNNTKYNLFQISKVKHNSNSSCILGRLIFQNKPSQNATAMILTEISWISLFDKCFHLFGIYGKSNIKESNQHFENLKIELENK